jgi:hypothetical protein
MSLKSLNPVDDPRPLLRARDLPPLSGSARRAKQIEARSKRETRRLERRVRRAAQKVSKANETSALERTIN